jgi:AcrR family transcriptional regulator
VPRAGLSTAVVVEEAARLADEIGLARVTVSGLAQRFGVAQPSMYNHVGSVDALRRHLAVLATVELGEALAAGTTGRAGSEALTALAVAYRRFALDHPGRYEATVRAPDPDDEAHLAASDHVLDIVLAVLRGYELEGDDAVDAARMLRSALHGFAALEAAGGFGLPRDIDRSFDQMVRALEAALGAWSPNPSGLSS